jgi:hypothetical protein
MNAKVDVVVVKDCVIAGSVYFGDRGTRLSLSPEWAAFHIAEGHVRAVPPPYAVRKQLRDATLAIGREKNR